MRAGDMVVRLRKDFNCTIQELKPLIIANAFSLSSYFNCTIQELKQGGENRHEHL